MPESVPRHRKGRHSATGEGTTTEIVPVFAMTDARTQCAHFVTDTEAAADRANFGRYVAIRGRTVLAASLTAPETSYCSSCVYWRAKNHTARQGQRPREKREEQGWRLVGTDSPDLVIAKRLLDELKLRGFDFRRTAPGDDAPLVGNRAGSGWIDVIHIAGFSHGCFARRQRTSPLIVPSSELVERRVDGSALRVLKDLLVFTTSMATSTPRRAGGRTLIDVDPDQLIWVLLARESTDRERQIDNQLTDLRAQVARIGGRIDRKIPENAVSAFKRQRVALPDGTFGYRVVRPEWEIVLTALRRG